MISSAVARGVDFLAKIQREDGSWYATTAFDLWLWLFLCLFFVVYGSFLFFVCLFCLGLRVSREFALVVLTIIIDLFPIAMLLPKWWSPSLRHIQIYDMIYFILFHSRQPWLCCLFCCFVACMFLSDSEARMLGRVQHVWRVVCYWRADAST
jgi:hypothetical protein